MAQLYTVRLQSQTDDQWRTRTFQADSVDQAAAIAERREANRAAYSLADRPAIRQVETRRHAEGVHAKVNLDLFAGSGLGGQDLLDYVERDHAVDGDGKAYGPNRHIRSHLQAHYQAEPYKIAEVERVDPTQEILRSALALQDDPDQWQATLQAMRDAGIPLNAVTGALYGLTWEKQIEGSTGRFVWASDTFQITLHTAYTLDQDAHDFFSDVEASEVTGTGYTADGVTLTSPTGTYDTASDQIRLDAADVSWSSSTISATDAIIWQQTGGASSTDLLLGAIDFGATVSTTSGTFSIAFDSTGIFVYDLTPA